MNSSAAPIRSPGLLLIAVLAAFGLAALGPLAHPQPVQAGTAENMEAQLLQLINGERSRRGVPALTVGPHLADYAGDRAAKMASTGRLEHPECLSCQLRNRGISFNRCAETISYTTYPWGSQAAQSIFNGWKGSSTHWGILMSRSYTRIGIGVAYRSSNRSTWASAVLVG